MLLRLLVVLLLAMNVGVAIWWGVRTPPPPVEPARTLPEVAPLRLLAETEPMPAEAAAAEAVGPLQSPAERAAHQCLEIGPFLTQVDLRRAMNALTPIAERIQFRETRASVRRGWRVFIAPSPSREAALATARQLAAAGLRDYFVVTNGAEQNTVSLGLYRELANAERRRAEVAALGLEASMEPRDDEIPHYWVDLDIEAGRDWRASLGGYSGVGSRSIPCA
jgi:hypothetical protein